MSLLDKLRCRNALRTTPDGSVTLSLEHNP